jgi:hypothetical protein
METRNISRVDETSAHMTAARIGAVVIITLVAAAAFALSFASLASLAVAADIPRDMAALLPVVIDGTIMLGTLGWLAMANRPERVYFRNVLAAGAAASIACNALHAVELAHGLPWPVRAAVAAVAPLSLLADTHGLALLIRTAMPAAPVPAPREERRQQAAQLRRAGTDYAAIGAALGVSATTARRDAKAGRIMVTA